MFKFFKVKSNHLLFLLPLVFVYFWVFCGQMPSGREDENRCIIMAAGRVLLPVEEARHQARCQLLM